MHVSKVWPQLQLKPLQHAFLVGILALLVYANSFPGDFILDDFSRVVENPLVASPDLLKIFTLDYWGADSNSGLYRPLTILSLALNRQLFGAEAWGYHMVNVLLHALCAIILYSVAACQLPRHIALMAAALFAVHPLHTEVVNVVVGRSELLAALFVLAAVRCHLDGRPPAVLFAAIFYLLGLWSKEHAVVLPALLLVWDTYDRGDRFAVLRRRGKSYLLLVAVAAGWFAQRYWVIHHSSIPPDAPDRILMPLHYLDTLPRLLTALKLQLLYVAKLLLPGQLSIHYGGSFAAPVSVTNYAWLAVLILAAIFVVLYLVNELRRARWTPRLVLCYLLCVLPTANLLILTGVAFAERLTYLPSAWFCCALAGAGHDYLSGTLQRRRLFFSIVIVLVLFWGARTVQRNGDYRSELHLARRDAQTQPDNPMLWMNLSTALLRQGEKAEALIAIERCVALAPQFPMGLTGYSEALYSAGRFSEALDYAMRALSADPGSTFPPAHLAAAKSAVKLGQFRLALEHLQAVGSQFVMYGVYWETLGRSQEGMGDHLGALQAYQREREVYFPPGSDVQLRMARILRVLGRSEEAEALSRQEEARRAALGSDAVKRE